ncbi:MAG: endolytic transglycosylase MltG [Nitrospirae bacterium]|nr:endolytic transglycosylase MltG [Nitrospirota bacterium]
MARKRKRRWGRLTIYAALLLFLFGAGFLSAQWLPYLLFPANESVGEMMFRVQWGESLDQVAHRLHEDGLVQQPYRFVRLARYLGVSRKMQAGAYMLSGRMTPLQILDHLTTGRVVRFKVTVPEGYNLYQIARLLEDGDVVPAEDFLTAVRDPRLLVELGIEGDTAEGYLYPETYVFSSSLTAPRVVRMMVEQFRVVYDEGVATKARQLGMTQREVVTLASLIEKESSVPEELPLVSAVFHNRLRIRMRLQSDPTVIYGLLPDFNGNLTRAHLEMDGPYNTYTRSGLPPGPIANPGREALIAALYPAHANVLYFVSRNDGTHIFSSDLKSHSRNVWKYQRNNPGQAEALGVR